MPIYDFACACGQRRELWRPMVRCNAPGPRCSCGKRMKKVVTAPGGVCTDGNFSYRHFQAFGVRPPPGGWPSRAALRQALAASGQEGHLDSPACRRIADAMLHAPAPGTRLNAAQVAELEAL
jgi:putative FmdB family regulatory protein